MLTNLEVIIIKTNGQKPFFVTHVTPMGNPKLFIETFGSTSYMGIIFV
jgi:hypothetical protein